MSKRKPSNVLSGLPGRLLSELFEGAVAHNLRGGQVLFRAGDVGDGCYRIQAGLVKGRSYLAKGRGAYYLAAGPRRCRRRTFDDRLWTALRRGGRHRGLFAIVSQPGQVSDVP